MNKFLHSLLAIVLAVTAVSCGGNSNDPNYTLSSISNPTDADSLMYYFGQLRAVKFWRDAERDSVLRTSEGQKDYMEGMHDAMKALNRSEAYLQGLLDGANHADNIANYSRNYGRKFNPDIMMKSMASALANDSVSNLGEIRREFYGIRNKMESDRDSREEQNATAALTAAGEKLGMTKLTNDLWKKTLVQGAGDQIERGDRIEVAMQMTTIDGHKIPINLPNEIIVGGRLMSILFSDAVLSMRQGDRCEFATTALALFGSHAHQMDLKPQSIVLMTISVIGEVDNSERPATDYESSNPLIQD